MDKSSSSCSGGRRQVLPEHMHRQAVVIADDFEHEVAVWIHLKLSLQTNLSSFEVWPSPHLSPSWTSRTLHFLLNTESGSSSSCSGLALHHLLPVTCNQVALLPHRQQQDAMHSTKVSCHHCTRFTVGLPCHCDTGCTN